MTSWTTSIHILTLTKHPLYSVPNNAMTHPWAQIMGMSHCPSYVVVISVVSLTLFFFIRLRGHFVPLRFPEMYFELCCQNFPNASADHQYMQTCICHWLQQYWLLNKKCVRSPSHYMLIIAWLSHWEFQARKLPSQWLQLETAFQHLQVWNHWMSLWTSVEHFQPCVAKNKISWL